MSFAKVTKFRTANQPPLNVGDVADGDILIREGNQLIGTSPGSQTNVTVEPDGDSRTFLDELRSIRGFLARAVFMLEQHLNNGQSTRDVTPDDLQ